MGQSIKPVNTVQARRGILKLLEPINTKNKKWCRCSLNSGDDDGQLIFLDCTHLVVVHRHVSHTFKKRKNSVVSD